MAQIRQDSLTPLRELLASLNQGPGLADPRNHLVPFYQFRQLHLARFLILESHVGEDRAAHGLDPSPWRPALVFMADVDGPAQVFLAELAVRAGPGLGAIFSHCEDFEQVPGGSETLLSWMQRKQVRAAATYVNWIGRTVQQIDEEQQLHECLRLKLDELLEDEVNRRPEVLFEVLKNHVARKTGDGTLQLTPAPRTPLGWWLRNLAHLILPPLVLLLLSPLLLVLLPFFLLRLRIAEHNDPEIVPRPDPARVHELSRMEDQLVSNQFSAFGDAKPGLFRRYTLIFLLNTLDYASRHIYKRGYLTRVQTIHFARWVLLDDKRRLLFASNYDGSLESYMDDFINKVAWGLNLVFSNGIGYPSTRWLLKGGAEYEQKFKNYLRRHQIRTDVWYKAYPDLTGHDLNRNTKIRQGLQRDRFPDSEAVEAWLRLI